MKFLRCKRCVMTNQRLNLSFTKEGICNSCVQFEESKKIDWNERWKELEELCKKYKRNDGNYDCIICISSGKDSHYLVYLFKEKLLMNPLGIMIDNFSWTNTGRKNFDNLSERFGIDIITFTPNRKEIIKRTREDFLNYLHPEKYWDEILYKKPLEIAQKMGIKLVIWGENTNITIGNKNEKETPNAKILLKDSNEFKDLDVIFTSYYVPWKSLIKRYEFAKQYGFKGLNDTNEWDREGYQGFEYCQVDTIGYLVNEWCKFIKFGFSATTEHCSNMIRHGEMSRKEAIRRVNKYDYQLDPVMLNDFCEGLNISKALFWETVNKFANKEILKNMAGTWRLKNDAE